MIESLKQQQPQRRLKPKKKARPEGDREVRAAPRARLQARTPSVGNASRRHPFFALLALGGAALLVLALGSELTPATPKLAGPPGHRLAGALLRPLGLLSALLPPGLLVGAGMLVGLVRPTWRLLKRGVALLAGLTAGLLNVAVVAPQAALLGFPVAGSALLSLGAPIASGLSVVGGGLVTSAVSFACLSVASDHGLSRLTVAALRALTAAAALLLRWIGGWARSTVSTAVQEHREARRDRANSALDFEAEFAGGPGEVSNDALDDAVAAEAEARGLAQARRRRTGSTERQAPGFADPDAAPPGDEAGAEAGGAPVRPQILTIGEDGRIRDLKARPEAEPIALSLSDPAVEVLSASTRTFSAPDSTPALDDDGSDFTPAAPQIVDRREPVPGRQRRGGAFTLSKTGKGFTLPTVELLEVPPEVTQDIDRSALTETAQKLTQKLADFGIKGRVETIRPGPVITMYEFVPAPGIRVSKIASLSDDLAMAMEALQVRIVAPIPGKNVVGIEVPNKQRQKVHLREILEEDGFAKMTSPLTLAFGKDTEGQPYVGDLSRMPHLLVAGTTGSGKSVSMNSMIMSLLFKASPEEVRMIMIDPKMVELSMYEGIPHLLLPVVQDAQKAPLALRWAVEEMERRYHLIGKLKVKDLKAYNEKVARLKLGEKLEELAAEPPKQVLVVDVANGETEEEALARLAEQAGNPPSAGEDRKSPPLATQTGGLEIGDLEKLPYIVIIIDELADLMMVASRDVEQSIARIAAKARAAGIHLVIATQRPSTDVISGVIKSNLPVRIAFRLASRHDSATIINGPGAERLLGEGDMLHIPPGGSDALRLHGAWVREAEIERVVDFWKAQGQPVYDEEILKPRLDEEGGVPGADEVPDELYDQALAVVCQLDKVSISLLQRKMGVGYNRAADLIERMERDGAIGPANGIKPREVLIKPLGEARL